MSEVDEQHFGTLLIRVAIAVLAVLLIVAAWFLIARPSGNWMDKRAERGALEADLADLQASNDALTNRRDALFTPEEIEKVARRDYNLVFGHEEAYAVLPTPERDAAWFHAWPY